MQKREPNISTLVAESSFSGMTRRREREAKKEEEDTNPNWELTKRERNKQFVCFSTVFFFCTCIPPAKYIQVIYSR